MAKNWMQALNKLEGAVTERYNPFAHVIRSPSPSLNFVFGNSHGLPLGYSMVLYGPPAGGKSLISNAMIGQLHQDDPEAIVVKFNTEFREQAQLTPEQAAIWGIDQDRYVSYEVNAPDLIFDRIEKDIAALCQEGAPIKMVIIDSINSVQGRRSMNADTIMTQQIGDLALTLQEGLKRILPVQRKYKFALILTAHVGAEMDQTEQMRGNKVRMAASFGVKHHAEYFLFVEPNQSAKGRMDLLEKKFEDEAQTDMMDKAEVTGHKVRVQMKKSSLGPKLRTGEFTFDYKKGIINTHEEVFLLGLNRGIIEHPNNLSYGFGEKVWKGKPAILQAIKEDKDLYAGIIDELKRRDLAGSYRLDDELAIKEAKARGEDVEVEEGA